ncbi:autotransporter secretion inner membrane protein TamB [Malonomonas rubra DSM 5091]|uniref:Autotransporter secretion inner membrane protein TamB n=1 Tax=Malonomonas rubra DSM 5091 TaxID=1122189 RepID=A0A1M6KQW9_MALRU|nr:translocation/assembly module TamB domain-containing protein [Malonomonas rubra]SHJ61383.1 autotransporter secretion inner membrane protein TamB [Malonomonas rubra DSM 5091]
MKLWRVSIFLFLLLLLGLCSGLGWLLYTESGANWLLPRIAAASGGQLASVEGTLLGKLQLQGLKIEQPTTTISCDSIKLNSALSRLFPLRLKIERLKLTGLSLNSQPAATPAPPPKVRWPNIPWWLDLLEVELQQLEMKQSVFQQADRQTQIEQFSASGHWRDKQLQVTTLELSTPDIALAGNIRASFGRAALLLELQADNRKPEQPWQQLQLKGSLQADDNSLLSGPISVALADPQGPWLAANGEFALSAEQLQFQHLQLHSKRRAGSLLLSGKLNLASSETGLVSKLQLNELDLQPEVGQPLKLSGAIELNGQLESYRGNFTLASRAEPPLTAQLSGNFSGDRQQVSLSELTGVWLQGQLNGQLQADWQQGWQVNATFSGRELDPQQIHDRLLGKLNFNLNAAVVDNGQGATGQLSVTLDESVLQNQTLTGLLELKLNQRQLEISRLDLQGNGFGLQGHGALADRVQLSWQIDQLDQLISGLRGKIRGTGKLSLAPEGVNADFTSHGEQLSFDDLTLASWQLQGKMSASEQFELAFSGHELKNSKSGISLDQLQLAADGNLQKHSIELHCAQTESSLNGQLTGGWDGQKWQGNLTHLRLEDSRLGRWQTKSPVTLLLSAQQLQFGTLQFAGSGGGSILLQGNYLPPAQQGEGQLAWQGLDLGLFNPWLPEVELSGTSNGSLTLQPRQTGLQGQVDWQGELKTRRQTFSFVHAGWQSKWTELGLDSNLKFEFSDGGRLEAELSSDDPFAFHRPHRLKFQLRGENLALQRVQPWLLPGLNLTGKLRLQSDGHWSAEQPWQLSGLAEISAGKCFWREDEEIISAELSTAQLRWHWHQQLSGKLELQLEERGQIDAEMTLPISASWPLTSMADQPLSGELTARLQELGLFSILFPGQLQESSGQLKVDLQLGGFWQQPQLQGDVRLFDAQAYLPGPGIQLNDVELSGRFDRQLFSLDSFQLRSGNGLVSGRGSLQLAEWKPQRYQLSLTGNDFQLFNLPDLQADVSPELTIDGDFKQVNIKGILRIPQLFVKGQQKTALAENSPDLVVVDAPEKRTKPLRIQPQIDLQLLLGEKVLLKTSGIDARLEGGLRMESTPQQMLAAFGEIRVVKGRYASYGVNLDISRGNLIFNGGPLNQPLLDILALRTAGEVKAGVQVSGTPKRPEVKLYSEPMLPETDILSYIVLGRPVGAQGNQSSVLMSAAGALLSQGESVVLQEKLKGTLGLDVLDINAGNGDTESSVITTGKYLRPDLYVSFGYSLFNNSNEVKLRYTLSPRWEVESNFGNESGADLFYKIDIP